MTYLTSLLDNFLFVCLLSATLGYCFGADGVWVSFVLAEILTIVALAFFIAWRQRRFPRQIADFLCLPKGFGKALTKLFAQSAANMEEVVKVSERARQYLLANGASSKEAMLMALSIEEMGGNIIRWGFKDDKSHSIDILMFKEETWSIRIRDDCKPFDPKKWLEIHRDDDQTANIGIRSICAIAKDVRYSRTLGLNYLLIRL